MKSNEIIPGETYMIQDFGPAKVLYVHEKDVTIEVTRTVKEIYKQVCVGFVQPLHSNEEEIHVEN